MESRSGETYRPHHSRSSPVLTMMVRSLDGTTWRRPSTNFAPPVPPVSTTIMRLWFSRRSLRDQQRPELFLTTSRGARLSSSGTQDKPASAGAEYILLIRCGPGVGPDAARVFPD